MVFVRFSFFADGRKFVIGNWAGCGRYWWGLRMKLRCIGRGAGKGALDGAEFGGEEVDGFS